MNNQEFSETLLSFFSSLEYIISIEEMQNDPTRLKIRARMNGDYFLEARINQKTNTISFCLLKNDSRIWGLDYDVLRDWHIHSLENPDSHVPIPAKSLPEILEIFKNVMQKIYSA